MGCGASGPAPPEKAKQAAPLKEEGPPAPQAAAVAQVAKDEPEEKPEEKTEGKPEEVLSNLPKIPLPQLNDVSWHIMVRRITGELDTVMVNHEDTIRIVKARMRQQDGGPLENKIFKLVFEGRSLDPAGVVHEHLQKGSVVDALILGKEEADDWWEDKRNWGPKEETAPPAPEDSGRKQWVSDILDFSSQAHPQWHAIQIIGQPKVYGVQKGYGDFAGAWAHAGNPSYRYTDEFLVLRFPELVPANSRFAIEIYETFNPGSIVKISVACHASGTWPSLAGRVGGTRYPYSSRAEMSEVWHGERQRGLPHCHRIFRPDGIKSVPFAFDVVRLDMETNGDMGGTFFELDAVCLHWWMQQVDAASAVPTADAQENNEISGASEFVMSAASHPGRGVYVSREIPHHQHGYQVKLLNGMGQRAWYDAKTQRLHLLDTSTNGYSAKCHYTPPPNQNLVLHTSYDSATLNQIMIAYPDTDMWEKSGAKHFNFLVNYNEGTISPAKNASLVIGVQGDNVTLVPTSSQDKIVFASCGFGSNDAAGSGLTADAIVVSGAGHGPFNNTYIPKGQRDGVILFQESGGRTLFRENGRWQIVGTAHVTRYHVDVNTSLPPTEGWQVTTKYLDYQAPAPTLRIINPQPATASSRQQADVASTVPTAVVVSGAGHGLFNNTYIPKGQRDGVTLFQESGGRTLFRENGRWQIAGTAHVTRYHVDANTSLPPTEDWQVTTKDAGFQAPVPTLKFVFS